MIRYLHLTSIKTKISALENEIQEVDKLIKLQKQKLELLWRQKTLIGNDEPQITFTKTERSESTRVGPKIRDDVPHHRRNVLPPSSKEAFSLNYQYQIQVALSYFSH